MSGFVSEYLTAAKADGRRRKLRRVVPLSARECRVDGRICVDFSSNDYLALSGHEKLKAAAVAWTEKYGTGSRASRLITGTFEPYLELEKKIAAWKGTEAALILGSGYLANAGVIAAVAGRKTAIFADKLNHNSLVAGCQLAQAEFNRYPHGDLPQLEAMLQRAADRPRRLIVSDTVFSMDGDLADGVELARLALQHDTLLYLDDAHATGVFGSRGNGLAEAGLLPREKRGQLLVMGTFSKALGAYGAYLACSAEMKDYLVNRCATFIYSTALPPGVYGTIGAAVELVQTDEYGEIRRLLRQRAKHLSEEIRRLGYNTGNTQSPIIPVIVEHSEAAVRLARKLRDKGLLAVPIRPPTVPQGGARLRLSLNAAHTDTDIAGLLDALQRLRDEFA